MINTILKQKAILSANKNHVCNFSNSYKNNKTLALFSSFGKSGNKISWIYKKINNFYYFEDIDKCEKIDKFDKLESFIVDDSMTSNISTTIYNYDGEIVIISYIDCNIFPTKIRI